VQPNSPALFLHQPCETVRVFCCLSTPTYRYRNRRRVDIA